MYGGEAFKSWFLILLGAVIFASLFVLIALMTERVFEGQFVVTGWVVSLGATAFAGYIAVAQYVRLKLQDS